MSDHYFRKDYQRAKQWQLDREEERVNRLRRLQNRGLSKTDQGGERLEDLRRKIQLAEQEKKPRK